MGQERNGLYDKWNVRIRDIIIFLIGVGGIINELWLIEEPRPSVLIFLGSLIGVPFVLGMDEKKGKNGGDKEQGPPRRTP